MKIIAYFILVKVLFILSFCLAEAENIVSISVGTTYGIGTYGIAVKSHACALSEIGQVWCWGYGRYGQLGYGKNKNRSYPVLVRTKSGMPLKNVIFISAGSRHTCAVLRNGEAWCWGNGYYGQLGNGKNKNRSYPVLVKTKPGVPLEKVVFISAGDDHTCAVLRNGQAQCWGYGYYGQLGYGYYGQLGDGKNKNRSYRSYPVLVKTKSGVPLENVIFISAGYNHTCAVLRNGEAWCWGYGYYGQLGDGKNKNRSYPVLVKTQSEVPLEKVVFISAGDDHTCAVLRNGQAQCWGYNLFGQLGDGKNKNRFYPVLVKTQSGVSLENVIFISAGYNHTCVLRNGQAQCWGKNQLDPEPLQVDQSNYLRRFKHLDPEPLQVDQSNYLRRFKHLDPEPLQVDQSNYLRRFKHLDPEPLQVDQSNYLRRFKHLDPEPLQVDQIYPPYPFIMISTGTNYTCVLLNGQVQCWKHQSKETPIPMIMKFKKKN